MASNPVGRYSPDGLWWWDGSQWRPAVSADRMWRWDGQRWVPNAPMQPAGGGGGGGAAVAIVVTLLGFGAVIVLVSILVIVVLLTMGNQIANVFSNVVAALGDATPSP